MLCCIPDKNNGFSDERTILYIQREHKLPVKNFLICLEVRQYFYIYYLLFVLFVGIYMYALIIPTFRLKYKPNGAGYDVMHIAVKGLKGNILF